MFRKIEVKVSLVSSWSKKNKKWFHWCN